MRQPVTVLLFADKTLGCRIGQRVVLVGSDVLQRDGQVTRAWVIDHKDHAELGQALENLITALTGQIGVCAFEAIDLLQRLRVLLAAISQLNIANGNLLFVFSHCRSNLGLHLAFELRAQAVALTATITLQRPQLLGHLLTGGLETGRLGSQLRLQRSIVLFLLTQGLMQTVDLRLQVLALLVAGQLELGQLFLMLLGQAGDAQTLLLMGDSVAQIEVTVDDPDKVGEILAPLAEKFTGKAVIADWKAMNSALFEALQVERVAMFFALSFMVLVAAFNILSSLVMLVRAKTRDIAIMRTMGATRRSMLKIFVTTGTTVGAIGTMTGLALGAIILFFREPIVDFIAFATGQEIWDPQVRFLSTLPSRTDPWEVFGIVMLALGMSFLATLYPALKAANTDPVQVLRYE